MARLDTGWHAHPKILRLSPVGMALHAWSISYCDYTRSDGFIPLGAWPTKLQRGVRELNGGGLWEGAPGGYHLHDYTDYNRSRAQIEAEQAATTRRVGRLRNGRRNGASNGVTSPVSNGVTLARADVPRSRSTKYDAAVAVNSGPDLARAREAAAAAATFVENLPDEVRRRLAQPPIGSHAVG